MYMYSFNIVKLALSLIKKMEFIFVDTTEKSRVLTKFIQETEKM